MSTAKITTTPTPLTLVDKINEIITNYLPNDGTAESAKALEGLTATIAELNKLDGVTATTTELNYVDGVTSNIQTQLNGKLSTSGTAAKATADASGNNIVNTYATKATAITGLSASGKTITYTKGNGTTGTITTQDTVYSLPTASSSTLGGIKVGSGLSISSGVLSATGGGIVASSLGTNGYVKFSNGLILQWGYYGTIASTTSVTCDLNIAFTTAGYFVHTATPTLNGSSRGVVGGAPKSTTQITLSNGNDKIDDARWIAIGKQQWGTLDNGSNAREWTKTFTYPLTMSTLLSVITTVKHNTNGWAFTSVCHNVNNTSCLCCYYGIGSSSYCRYASVVIVGKQQWGCNSSLGENTTVSFPISFTINCYMVLGNISSEPNTPFNDNVYPRHTWTTSDFVMRSVNQNSKEFTWIALGK